MFPSNEIYVGIALINPDLQVRPKYTLNIPLPHESSDRRSYYHGNMRQSWTHLPLPTKASYLVFMADKTSTKTKSKARKEYLDPMDEILDRVRDLALRSGEFEVAFRLEGIALERLLRISWAQKSKTKPID